MCGGEAEKEKIVPLFLNKLELISFKCKNCGNFLIENDIYADNEDKPCRKIVLGDKNDTITRRDFIDKASKVAAILKSNGEGGYILVDEITYLEFLKDKKKQEKYIFGLHSFLNLYND